MKILNKILEIIQNNEISDSELMMEVRINYTLVYANEKVYLIRNHYGYSNEDYCDPNGTTSLLNEYSIFETECSLKEYTNILVSYIMDEQEYRYIYGNYAMNKLNFMKVED